MGWVVSVLLVRQYVRFASGQGLDSRFCHVSGVFNCEAVEASGYTAWAGVPIASVGVLYFLVLSLVAWGKGPGDDAASRRCWQGLFALLTLPAAAFAWGLAMLSAIAIRSLCLGCTLIYGVMLVCAIAPFWFDPGRYLESLRAVPADVIGAILGRLKSDRGKRRRALFAGALLVVIAAVNFAYPLWAVRRGDRRDPVREYQAQAVTELGAARPGLTEGDPAAPIRIVVFTDFACPYCADFNRTLKPLLKEYTGRYFLAHKHYPLSRECNPIMQNAPFDHPRACRLAQMAEVLGELGEFEAWGDRLYLAPDTELYPVLKALADEAGIDYGRWASRSSHAAVRRNVEADIREGLALGIRALPAVYINGRYVEALDGASIRAVLEFAGSVSG